MTLPPKSYLNPALICIVKASITHAAGILQFVSLAAVLGFACAFPAVAASNAAETELTQFKSAWEAAKRGDHDSFKQISDGLQDYVLYPYLQYEDYRNRRRSMPVNEMADFLATHGDFAFTPGLRNAWLKSLAERQRWADLVAYSEGVNDTVLRCQRVRGQIILKQTDGVMAEAQKLWTVGKSQPDECDPVFTWLVKNNGVSASLAWERIGLAIEAGNRSLATYLGRFVPADQRRWLDEWRQMSLDGYRRLERARKWPDNAATRMLAAASILRLARDEAGLAAQKFDVLDGHFKWEETRRATLLRDIALYSAVAMDADTNANMLRVPLIYRDSQLLEWWVRFTLSTQDWPEVAKLIEQMPEETRNDDRWRYWAGAGRSALRAGQAALAVVAGTCRQG